MKTRKALEANCKLEVILLPCGKYQYLALFYVVPDDCGGIIDLYKVIKFKIVRISALKFFI